MMVWISVESVVISPLSFFIASIWLLSLFFFNNLASSLFCWSFQKTSSWIYWFFWRSFCVSVSFSSALILVTSCLLLAFEFFWSYFSSPFNFDDRVSNLDLFLLLMWAFIAINFPLDTALNVSQRFWYIVSLFLLVLKDIFISVFISLFYSFIIPDQVVQLPCYCVVLSAFLNSEF